MNEDFIFRLGADVSSFTKSITEVEAELNQARKAVKGALGDDLIKANQYVENLEQSLKDLKSTGIQVPGAAKAATEIKNIAPAAQKAQNTLTGLSGVVRDLPFGFIAIQNNLPILIDQFSSLSKTSGGIGGALKNLSGALIGPAGAAFAFGAVVSVVTGVIQKYGSLSNAIKVLTADNAALVKAQFDFAKESEKASGAVVIEDSKVRTLTQALLDSKTPRKDQIAYYEELKRISPDVVSGIGQENLGTAESNRLISQNVLLRAELVRLEIQEAGIKAAASGNAEALAKARNKEAEAQKKLAGFTAEYNAVSKASGQNPRAAQGTATLIKTQTAVIAAAKKEQEDLIAVQNEYLGQLAPITLRVAEINNQFKIQTDTLNKTTKAQQESAQNAETAAERRIAADKEWSKKAIASWDAYNESVRKSGENSVFAGLTENEKIIKANTISFMMWTKKLREANREAKTANLIPKKIGTQTTVTPNQPQIDTQVKAATDALQVLNREANLSAAFNLVNDTFFSPLQNLFTDLISGADGAFKAFTKAVLQSINQIVAKIIATGIISLLFNLISGGTAGLGKAVLGDIGKALGFAFGSVANPNFGGVTGGGMAMSGAVNVVLRGQDLVGSLNRTNAQINRVG
jgi:hypothetical protein